MPKFREKSVVVEAHQWFKNGDHPMDGKSTIEGKLVRRFNRPDMPGHESCGVCGKEMYAHGWIDTLEGGHIVCPGDWIITGVSGENYPSKDVIFRKTYEPVVEDIHASQQQGEAANSEDRYIIKDSDISGLPCHECKFWDMRWHLACQQCWNGDRWVNGSYTAS